MKKIIALLFLTITITTTYSQDLVPYRIKDKWGYSDLKEKIVIQPKYNSTTFITKWFNESVGYTYKDTTCEYANCQTIEYLYWALTSILGAQATNERLSEIQNEWKLNTKAKVQNTDTAIYAILTNPTYKMPTVLPDGTYRH